MRAATTRVLVMLAAMSALATGTAVTAPAAEANGPPSCAWQPLTLLNGWSSAQSIWNTGDPEFCVDNGVTYLAGSLHQHFAGDSEFAQLPSWAAPASNVYLSVYAYGGTAGVLYIDTIGHMEAYLGDATEFTSLAGVSFPAAQSAPASTPLALKNGWYSADSEYGTGDPAYFVSGGIVHLSGSMANTETPADGHFAWEPQAIAPDFTVETNVYLYDGAPGVLSMDAYNPLPWVTPINMFVADTDEAVGQTGPNATAFTSLAGVAYPAFPAPFQQLNLINGWANYGGDNNDGPVSYYVSGSVVYLSGSLSSQNGNCEFAVLPSDARPAHTLYFIVNAEGLPHVDLAIYPNGTTCLWGSSVNYSSQVGLFAALGGISYQQGS